MLFYWLVDDMPAAFVASLSLDSLSNVNKIHDETEPPSSGTNVRIGM